MSILSLHIKADGTTSHDINDWSEDIQLTNDPGESYKQNLAIDSKNNIHIVWEDNGPNYPSATFEILYKKFDGFQWSESIKLDNNDMGSSEDPTIAIDSNDNIHIAFIDSRRIDGNYEIYYTTYEGISWTNPVRITVNSGINKGWSPQLEPKMIIDSLNNIYIFWSGFKNYIGLNDLDIFYVKYDGNSWSNILDVTNDIRPEYDHFNPDIAIDSKDNIHITYTTTHPIENQGTFDYEINYRVFDGNIWSNEKRIDNVEGGFVGFPSIGIDSETNLHIVWSDDRDHWNDTLWSDIYYSKFENNGNIIIDNLKITNDLDSELYPDLIIDEFNNIHAVTQNLNDDNGSLNYLKINNTGIVLENYRLSTSYYPYGNLLINPHIAIDSLQQLHVAFGDNRSGNNEIYYKHSYSKDLWINPSDITISNSNPTEEEVIAINANIHNFGFDQVTVKIDFYLDFVESNDLIDSKSIEITTNDAYLVSVQWVAFPGIHDIIVIIDPDNVAEESNEFNNMANISINVSTPPELSIEIIYPLDNAIIAGKLTVQTRTTNANKVEFYLDRSLKYTASSYPFNWEWDTTKDNDGAHIIKAVAYDDAGNTAEISIDISVDNSNIEPTIKIETPSDGEIVAGTIKIKGKCTDPDGEIIKVELKIDDENWIEVEGRDDWEYLWNTEEVFNGKHRISARSYDGIDHSEIDVVVVEVSNQDSDDGAGDGISNFLYQTLILFVILIVIIIVLFLISRKEEHLDEDKNGALEVEITEEEDV